MGNYTLYITKKDCDRLRRYIVTAGPQHSRDRANVEALDKKIRLAKIVDSRTISSNVITMNSRARLKDIATKEEITVTLVYPDDSDIDNGRLSVLSPIGTIILGHAQGDVVEWRGYSRTRQLWVREICYQPEAAGNYDV